MQAVALSKEELIAAMRADFNFFAEVALAEVHTSDFPPEYIALLDLLVAAGTDTTVTNYKFGVGFPRGHAKTTVAKLFCAWLFLFTHRHFILVTCANEAKAQSFCSDVMLILSAPNIKSIFGDWEPDATKNAASLKQFVLNGKQCILYAVGAGGDPRGANIKFKRPDVQICDDIQSRSNARSLAESKALYDWYNATLYFTKAPTGVLHIYIGNMYPYEGAILKKLKANPEYVTLIVGAVLADGTALWPAVATLDNLLADYRTMVAAGTPEIFLSEILNCANSFDSVKFNHERVLQYSHADAALIDYGFVVIDPATDTAGADDTTIGSYVGYAGKLHMRRMLAGSYSPLATIKEAISAAEAIGAYTIFVERVGYQRSLIFWANKYIEDNKLSNFIFVPVDRANKNKNAAILSMLIELQTEQIALHADCAGSVYYQISNFDPARKTNRDDILDNLAYATKIPTAFPEYVYNIMDANIITVEPVIKIAQSNTVSLV